MWHQFLSAFAAAAGSKPGLLMGMMPTRPPVCSLSTQAKQMALNFGSTGATPSQKGCGQRRVNMARTPVK